MAISLIGGTVERSVQAVYTFTMRLRGQYRTRELQPGDLLILAVTEPKCGVTRPLGWTQPTTNFFYKIYEPSDLEYVTLSAPGAQNWEVYFYAVDGDSIKLHAGTDWHVHPTEGRKTDEF